MAYTIQTTLRYIKLQMFSTRSYEYFMVWMVVLANCIRCSLLYCGFKDQTGIIGNKDL